MNSDDLNHFFFFKFSTYPEQEQRAQLLNDGIHALTQAWCVSACVRARARVCLCCNHAAGQRSR